MISAVCRWCFVISRVYFLCWQFWYIEIKSFLELIFLELHTFIRNGELTITVFVDVDDCGIIFRMYIMWNCILLHCALLQLCSYCVRI